MTPNINDTKNEADVDQSPSLLVTPDGKGEPTSSFFATTHLHNQSKKEGKETTPNKDELGDDPFDGNQIVLYRGYQGNGSFRVLTPHVSLRKDVQIKNPWRYLSAMTCVPEPHDIAFGYQKHRADATFNKKFHESVNGMISAYRWGSLKMFKAMKRSGSFINDSLIRQAKWADVDLLRLQVGLAGYDEFSVDMLNQDYLVRHIL